MPPIYQPDVHAITPLANELVMHLRLLQRENSLNLEQIIAITSIALTQMAFTDAMVLALEGKKSELRIQ